MFANGIDSISSSNSSDTNVPIYIEGMTYNNGDFTFTSQIVNTDASDGQTRVALTTPLAECTRMRGLTQGDVYAYENTTLSGGIPTDTTKIHNILVSTDRTSLKAGTAIAKNNYFVLTKSWATMGRAAGSTAGVDIRLKVLNVGNAALGNNFYTSEIQTISLNNNLNQEFKPFEIIPPNSLVSMTAIASGGTQDVKAGFMEFFADIV